MRGTTMRAELTLPHGHLPLPTFLPDATTGVVRGLDSADVAACGIAGVVMNTFHLMQRPGVTTVRALGGLHRMAGWDGPIVTDSGGFQAYSMIRENAKYGRLTDDGITFRREDGERINFTPEKSVQLQLAFGADVVICLDDCTHAGDSRETQQLAVTRTVAWARRCRAEFDKLCSARELDATQRPKLFAVIQGGAELDLRRACAEALLEIGFDGFGFGGWPLDAQGALLTDIVAYTRGLVPADFPMHALGIGHPQSIIACAAMGYGIFDCAMPTRDARHGRLYVGRPVEGEWRYVYARDDKHIKQHTPADPECDCPTCRRYSLGYLHHLFKLGDAAFQRLATIHNLRFMARLMDGLRPASKGIQAEGRPSG